jgi:predicted RNA-binding Zn-ribbon protein involved in translation (DUF1610 family)
MELEQNECPKCGAAMAVMSTMPSLKENASWRFLLCPDCGKVETVFRETNGTSATTSHEK